MSTAPTPNYNAIIEHLYDNTLGALLVGLIASTMVFGILISQVYTYYRVFPQDKISYKLVVAGLMIIQIVTQGFISHSFYIFTVTHFGNVAILLFGDVPITLLLQTPLGSLSGTIVKVCFAIRVWRFSGRNWSVTGVIIILSFVQMAFSCLYTYHTFLTPQLAQLASPVLQRLATISLGVGAFVDLLTAVTLCWCLQKYKTGQRQSDSLVHSLTIYAVNTGVVTSVFSLAVLLLYNRMPTKLIFLGVYFVLSHLYAVSFVATLNSRYNMKADGELGTTGQFNLVYPAVGTPNDRNMVDLGALTMKSFESPDLSQSDVESKRHTGLALYREDW